MSIRFAINGLGRVGRALLRVARRYPQLELVAVNDLAPADQLVRLIARDTVHGRFDGQLAAEPGALIVDGRRIPVLRAATPEQIPWSGPAPRIVVEATGAFRGGGPARGHLRGPVHKVVLAWNPEEEGEQVDVCLCLGINQASYDPLRHHVISNSSCTTNCIAPVVAVLHRAYGVRHGLINTVHGYTNNQTLLDTAHPEPRRARAAAVNMIPVATRAARALSSVLPELAGRLDGVGVRVPVADGALLDLVVELERPAEVEEVRQLFRAAAAGELAGILAVCEEELVSSDFIGDPHSAVVDLPLVQAIDRHMLRVIAWYDNEWGYANRLAELLLLIGSHPEA